MSARPSSGSIDAILRLPPLIGVSLCYASRAEGGEATAQKRGCCSYWVVFNRYGTVQGLRAYQKMCTKKFLREPTAFFPPAFGLGNTLARYENAPNLYTCGTIGLGTRKRTWEMSSSRLLAFHPRPPIRTWLLSAPNKICFHLPWRSIAKATTVCYRAKKLNIWSLLNNHILRRCCLVVKV